MVPNLLFLCYLSPSLIMAFLPFASATQGFGPSRPEGPTGLTQAIAAWQIRHLEAQQHSSQPVAGPWVMQSE